MFERFFKNRFEYSHWDGTQRIEGLDADDILQAISDDYLENVNLRRALMRLMLEGIPGGGGFPIIGLHEMLERLRNQRNRQLSRYNMTSGVMDDLREKLMKIKRLEGESLQQCLDESPAGQQKPEQQSQGEQQGQHWQSGSQSQSEQTSQQVQPRQGDSNLTPESKRKQEYLDKLPKDIRGQVNALSEYDFMNNQAREKFNELMESLKQQMIEQFFPSIWQSFHTVTPEDIARLYEMIQALNKMLRERQEGRNPDFDSFIQKYSQYFPGVNLLDHLIGQMQQQMASRQGILDNLSPEQGQELQNLSEQLMGNDRIQLDLMELVQNLKTMASIDDIRTHFPFSGSESLPFNAAIRMIGRLQQMERLEDQFLEARRLLDLEVIESEKVRELLGDEEYQSIELLKALMKMLEEKGYIQKKYNNQKKGNDWALTARGIRKIGQKALQDIFNKLKRDGFGRHISPFRGIGGERTDESKVYQFGDPFLLDLEKTLMNAIHRRGIGTPVGLEKEDFEVYRTEFTTQSSTVLMIDMSLSMIYNGCQPAAKKAAVALESLIRSQFPRDNLYIVGFDRIAREYKPDELIEISRYDYGQGTNMAHGLMLARKLLARHHRVNKQIIMITDGGPTVWYENGEWLFNWPYNHLAEQQTLLEAKWCTREGITINTFMLEDDSWMIAFVNQMAQINHGRTFYVDKNNLGEYLLVDYLNSKRKFVR